MNTTSRTVIHSTCPHCGDWHNGACPEIRAIEYYPDGRVKRVEYERGQGKPFYQLPSVPPQQYEQRDPLPWEGPFTVTCDMALPREAPAAMVRQSRLHEMLETH